MTLTLTLNVKCEDGGNARRKKIKEAWTMRRKKEIFEIFLALTHLILRAVVDRFWWEVFRGRGPEWVRVGGSVKTRTVTRRTPA